MRKTQLLMNKPVYLGLPVLDLSKTVTTERTRNYYKVFHRKCFSNRNEKNSIINE